MTSTSRSADDFAEICHDRETMRCQFFRLQLARVSFFARLHREKVSAFIASVLQLLLSLVLIILDVAKSTRTVTENDLALLPFSISWTKRRNERDEQFIATHRVLLAISCLPYFALSLDLWGRSASLAETRMMRFICGSRAKWDLGYHNHLSFARLINFEQPFSIVLDVCATKKLNCVKCVTRREI